jgi:uncharacterized protein
VIGHRNPIAALFVWLVRGYQVFISPGLPGRCKYYPSCSQYAIDALSEYGVLRGLVLASWRVLRCNPFSYGGYDPVERQNLFSRRHKAGYPPDGSSAEETRESCRNHGVEAAESGSDARAGSALSDAAGCHHDGLAMNTRFSSKLTVGRIVP